VCGDEVERAREGQPVLLGITDRVRHPPARVVLQVLAPRKRREAGGLNEPVAVVVLVVAREVLRVDAGAAADQQVPAARPGY
jgi:hypothetical protein